MTTEGIAAIPPRPRLLAQVSQDQVEARQSELRQYAERNGFPAPSLDSYFLNTPIEEIQTPPLVDGQFYPGLLHVGDSRSRDGVQLLSALEKTITRTMTPTHHYFERNIVKAPPLTPVTHRFVEGQYSEDIECEQWAKRIVAPAGRRTKRFSESFHSRVKVMTCIGFALAGYYDGPVVTDDPTRSYCRRTRMPTLQAIKDHMTLESRELINDELEDGEIEDGSSGLDSLPSTSSSTRNNSAGSPGLSNKRSAPPESDEGIYPDKRYRSEDAELSDVSHPPFHVDMY